MDIEFNKRGFSWIVGYKISYNELNEIQKKLSDEFTDRLKEIEFGSKKLNKTQNLWEGGSHEKDCFNFIMFYALAYWLLGR